MKTLVKHFKLFKRESKKWIKLLSLQSWTSYFEREMPEGCEKALSAMCPDFEAHAMFSYLNPEWNEPVTDELLKESARHEVLELLLYPLAKMAGEKYKPELVNEETHKIINRLEGVFKLMK